MQRALLAWYDANKRDLPWRGAREAYRVWVSEIMLQQTRAETVTGYYARFLARFPTVEALAAADEADVLKAWEGLGYYSRARNLHACAKAVCARGGFPETAAELRKLPGVGAYTAGAVASIAFGERAPAVDGNVLRVAARVFGIREDIGAPSVRRNLVSRVADLIPGDRPGDFNQALMELGATLCKPAPLCDKCPVRAFCDATDAGDADALPVKASKAPQRVIPRGVALVFCGERVLVSRREERLLCGMWCFPGFDHAETAREVEKELRKMGVNARFVEIAGNARHVFTHIIWEMTLFRFEASSMEKGTWATYGELSALPMPTAMRAARAYVDRILSE